jgi:hypothetical protein
VIIELAGLELPPTPGTSRAYRTAVRLYAQLCWTKMQNTVLRSRLVWAQHLLGRLHRKRQRIKPLPDGRPDPSAIRIAVLDRPRMLFTILRRHAHPATWN